MSQEQKTTGAVYRKSVHPQKVSPPLTSAPDLKHDLHVLDSRRVVLEKDVGIPMRNSITLYADIYRPNLSLGERSPSIVFFALFGKHGAMLREKFCNMDVDFSRLRKYTYQKLPGPIQQCGEWGYSFVSVDPRGTQQSEGDAAHYFSLEEGRDGYNVVEWVSQQLW